MTTLEDVLRQAEALVLEALRETEARCAVLAHHIDGSRGTASSDAVRELRALQDYRTGLVRRRDLIQQALAHPAGEYPPKTPLPPPPNRPVGRTQHQIQIRARRRS